MFISVVPFFSTDTITFSTYLLPSSGVESPTDSGKTTNSSGGSGEFSTQRAGKRTPKETNYTIEIVNAKPITTKNHKKQVQKIKCAYKELLRMTGDEVSVSSGEN